MTEAERLTAYFRFLDELRASGEVNMFGASVPLQIAYDLERAEAHETLLKWLRTFGYGSASYRAAMVVSPLEADQ